MHKVSNEILVIRQDVGSNDNPMVHHANAADVAIR
jgi:hypothetical protein